MAGSTQSHLYWLSCNKCSTRFLPPQNSKKMFMSSCGCIYCMRCVQASTQSGCITCKAAPGKVLPIGKTLPQQVMEMFNRNEESLAKINKRSNFQNLHFNRCLKLMTGMERALTDQMMVEEREAKHRQQEMKVMEERIREKQAEVDKLESALNSLNISRSPVHMEFIASPPVRRHRSGREEGREGMGYITSPPVGMHRSGMEGMGYITSPPARRPRSGREEGREGMGHLGKRLF